MAGPDHERDCARMDEVHAAVNEDKPVVSVVAPWGVEEAKRIIALVIDEYVNDFNRAMQQGPHELDVRTFTSKYDALWQAKLELDRASYVEAYKARFGDTG